MSGKTVLLISDIHTRYEVVNEQVRHAEELIGQPLHQVFVLGDFGFFSEPLRDHFRRAGKRFLRPVACIEGNHEDHGSLPGLAEQYADVVSYISRGQIHDLGPWQGLCLGGARYMDAAATPRGCEITEGDIQNCLAHDPGAVDLVLSHDCPPGVGVPNMKGLEHYGAPGVPEMAPLAEYYRPRWWFFGHHHRWFDQTHDCTRFIGLPQSWQGYALLDPEGEISLVRNEVAIRTRPWWKPW